MKIGIIEFEMHAHLLSLWHELLQNSEVEYDFLISEKINSQTQEIPSYLKKTFVLPKEISTLKNSIDAYDIIVFNTLHRNFEWFDFIFKTKKPLLLVHNSHFVFDAQKPNWRYLWKLKDKNLAYYYLKIILKEKIFSTKNILKNSTAFGFLNKETLEKATVSAEKKVYIPLVFNKEFEILPQKESLKIVIPGGISQARRNYKMLFEILKNLNPKEKQEFIFLGKPENKKMEKKLSDLSFSLNQKVSITYYKERIPQKKYNEIIREAHYLLCPIIQETQFYLQKEIYGKTKASGNESDCIFNGKIGIFPQDYPLYSWENLYYSDEKNLKKCLENLTFDEYFNQQNLLKDKLSFYSLNKSKIELINLLKSLNQK